jgi:hypothetical protein
MVPSAENFLRLSLVNMTTISPSHRRRLHYFNPILLVHRPLSIMNGNLHLLAEVVKHLITVSNDWPGFWSKVTLVKEGKTGSEFLGKRTT